MALRSIAKSVRALCREPIIVAAVALMAVLGVLYVGQG